MFIDVYPLYWTTSKGGIFMRYSYEFKRKAIEKEIVMITL